MLQRSIYQAIASIVILSYAHSSFAIDTTRLDQRYSLVGVIASTSRSTKDTVAVIRDQFSGKTLTLKPGDLLGGDSALRIKTVLKNKVELFDGANVVVISYSGSQVVEDSRSRPLIRNNVREAASQDQKAEPLISEIFTEDLEPLSEEDDEEGPEEVRSEELIDELREYLRSGKPEPKNFDAKGEVQDNQESLPDNAIKDDENPEQILPLWDEVTED